MRKIISFLLVVLVLSLSACGGSDYPLTNSEVTESTIILQNEEDISIDVLDPFELHGITYEIQLEELRNIVDYNDYDNLFITNDGSLYKIGNFSDGTRLKRIGEGIKFIKFSRGTIISDNNDVYTYNEESFSVSLFNDGMGYTLNTLIPSKDYLQSAHALMPDNNFAITSYIKGKELFLDKENSGNRVTSEAPIFTFSDEEEIEYFIDGTVKTNKGYYYFKETINYSQYDDVPTTYAYSLEKITVLNDDIVFVKHYSERFHGDPLICTVDRNGHLKIYNN